MYLSYTFSGGINLSFTGTELDSVQRPIFVVYGRTEVPQVPSCVALGSCTGIMILSIFSQQTLCRPQSAMLLVCTAPSLSGVPLGSINYTVVMDNAPGPSNTGLLSLSLVSNPFIPTDGLETTQYTPGAETPITIDVRKCGWC